MLLFTVNRALDDASTTSAGSQTPEERLKWLTLVGIHFLHRCQHQNSVERTSETFS